MSASKNLGKVFMTPKGIWDKTLNYTKLDIVTNKVGKISCGYIATTDIEKNIEITDNRWLKLFELLDGDLTEEYKAVQMDVANKATDVDANKKAVDLIYSQMQKLYDVEISTTTPTNERTGLWINPDDISGVINIPEIKDNEVSDVDTWSSKKIDNVTGSLKEDISNKITKFYASSQGKPHLADSDNGKIMDMMLYGKSEQKQYSGKNLFDKSTSKSAWISDDGIYIEKGEIGENTDVVSDYISVKENSTYIASFKTNYAANLIYWRTYNANKEFVSITKIANKITIPTGIRYVRVMISMQQQYCVAVNDELQVELGTEPTTYEPYTGGIPSPNPDYPQEIKSVVNPTVKIIGKNLLNATLQTATQNGVTCTNNGDGTYTLNGKLSSNTIFTLFSGSLSIDNKSKIILMKNDTFADLGIVSSYCAFKISSSWDDAINYPTIKEIPSGKIVQTINLILRLSNGGAPVTLTNILIKPMIVDASLYPDATYDDFEPYHEQTVTLPYTLNAIPVSSGGNVTIDGQQYVADYVDVERGKLVRMVLPVTVLDSGYGSGLSNSHQVLINKYIKNTTNDKIGIILCDKLRPANANDVWNGAADNIVSVHGMEANKITFRCTAKANDMDSALKLIKSCKIYIALAEPEEIDLTTEEISAFKALATYYPTTNISINSEQLDGYTVFNYPISMANGWNYVKQQIGDTRDYIYDMDARTQDTDMQSAEAYVNSEYAVALTELEV